MKNNQTKRLRKSFQYTVLGIAILLIILLIKNVLCVAHEFCPYSAICFGVMSLKPGFAKLLFPISVFSGILIVISTIFIGRRFCGYICPFGTMQEIIHKLNQKSKKNKQLQLPNWLHKYLNAVKYLILMITILAVFRATQFIYMKFCPVLAVSHPQNITISSAFTLFVIFGFGYFINRFWCRYLCPFAALMNVFQYLGKLLHLTSKRVQANEKLCKNCRLCAKNCPMQIVVYEKKRVENVNCIFCLECIESCPVENGIEIK